MEKITVTIERKESMEIEIPIPCFMRSLDEKDYIGVLDNNTVVHVYDSGTYKSITNSEPWIKQNLLSEAYLKYHSCTESEFFDKYNAVVESISLHPKLAV